MIATILAWAGIACFVGLIGFFVFITERRERREIEATKMTPDNLLTLVTQEDEKFSKFMARATETLEKRKAVARALELAIVGLKRGFACRITSAIDPDDRTVCVCLAVITVDDRDKVCTLFIRTSDEESTYFYRDEFRKFARYIAQNTKKTNEQSKPT